MASISLTRVSPTVFVFVKQDGDLDGALVKVDGEWVWNVDVCGKSIGSGSGRFTDAHAALVRTLDTVAPAFAS